MGLGGGGKKGSVEVTHLIELCVGGWSSLCMHMSKQEDGSIIPKNRWEKSQ